MTLSRRIRFVVDVLHPAHVHFFRNFIDEMSARGHEFIVTSRDKDCTLELLDAYRIPHRPLSRQATRKAGLAWELAVRTVRFWRSVRSFQPDYLVGIMGPTIALAGRALPSKTVVFYDTEIATATNWFAYPLADAVCTPDCYQGRVRGHQIKYAGYHELAYLHPNRFRPDATVLQHHGFPADRPFFLLRFVSWEASHDAGESGLSTAAKRRLVDRLSRAGAVLISSETPLPPDLERFRLNLPPAAIHDALAFADLLVGDSATMAAEAAVLGTHALFVSTTRRGYTDEMEIRYGLVHHFEPRQESAMAAALDRLLATPDLKADAARGRALLLAEKIDVTAWMVDLFERGLDAHSSS